MTDSKGKKKPTPIPPPQPSTKEVPKVEKREKGKADFSEKD
jgi:hypothetical protein